MLSPFLASRARPPISRGAVALAVAALALGCSARHHEARADRAALGILAERTEAVLGGREATVVHPEEVDEPPEDAPGPLPLEGAPEAAVERPRRVLRLAEALELAVEGNRDYQTRLESLYLTALELAGTRHDFSPQLAAVLTYLFADGSLVSTSHLAVASGSVSQVLPWGGDVALDASTDYLETGGAALPDTQSFSTSVGIRLTQPLLRGFGHEVSHEPLVQAERSMVYAVRDFELFREDFSIDVASRYYDLVQQQRAIENQRRNMESFVFARRQAEALFGVGRTSELDVLRARRSELSSRNTLIAAEETYELALDRFRIFLGLPPETPIDVGAETPDFVPVAWDADSAVRVAYANRLDVLNRQGQLEDAARGLSIARDGLLPDLNLDVGLDVFSIGADDFGQQELDETSLTAGLTLGLPVDRVRERNAYRRARIEARRARRSYEEFLDELRVEIESAFRELERRSQSLAIQTELIRDQEKNVRIAQIRFEQGAVPNRDVVESQQALLEARNALVSEQVRYEIARLELLRDLGILFIDDRGMWTP